MQNGSKTELVDFSSTISANTVYSIRIIKEGSFIQVLRDSQVQGSATDNSFADGLVGVGTFNDSAVFDNLMVSGEVSQLPTPTNTPSQAPTDTPIQGNFRRNRVFGFSQTKSWYPSFDSAIGGSDWELVGVGGARIEKWADPNFEGYSQAPTSSVPGNLPVDRILMNVSGAYGTDVNAWESAIRDVLVTQVQVYPQVQMIILQSVVGGPEVNPCDSVRAGRQWRYIAEAIYRVAANPPNLGGVQVVAGLMPEVRGCSDFSDGTGHLTSNAAQYIGNVIAQYYMNW